MKHTSETFLSVPGYEGLYEVSNLGNVKTLRKGRLLTQCSDKNGYKGVCLTKDGKSRTIQVHRLVAMAFLPNPENLPEVNHKDESHDNNCVENLEWISKKGNRNYGTYRERMSKTQKEKGTHSKSISAYDKKTLVFVKSYDSITEAEKELGLSKGSIGQALSGRTKTSGGYIWKYNVKLTLQDLEPKKNNIDISEMSADTRFFSERSSWLRENDCLDEEMAITVVNL